MIQTPFINAPCQPVIIQQDANAMNPTVPPIPTYEGNMDYVMMNNLTANNNISNYSEAQGSEESNDVVSQGVPHQSKKGSKASNVLPFWGNERTMNLNPLLLTNIKNSPYFKVNLYSLKTYHEVIDEIWNQVKHMEPWEKGSRRVSGQTGMCGSVRGVGAGGIVSTPFCVLYKLYTLRLTRKQVMGLIKHKDSPYIRALGFMYLRYTQPPESLWDWFSPYLGDTEEFDAKAGGGQKMTIGRMCRHLLVKLEWFSTLFPRIPVPIQKDIETKLREYDRSNWGKEGENYEEGEVYGEGEGEDDSERVYENDNNKPSRVHEEDDDYMDRKNRRRGERRNTYRYRSRSRSREDSTRRGYDEFRGRSRDYHKDSSPDRIRDRSLDKYRLKSPKRSPDRSAVRPRDRSRDRSKDRSNERQRDRSRDRSKSTERKRHHRSHRSPSDKKRSRDHKHKHKRRH